MGTKAPKANLEKSRKKTTLNATNKNNAQKLKIKILIKVTIIPSMPHIIKEKPRDPRLYTF